MDKKIAQKFQDAKVSFHYASLGQRFSSYVQIHMIYCMCLPRYSSQWRHNEHDGVSNRQPHDCLFNRLFRHRWKKTSKLRVTGLCKGNSPVTFPAQRASNAEKMFPFDDVIMLAIPIRNTVCCLQKSLFDRRLPGLFWLWAQPMRDDVTL